MDVAEIIARFSSAASLPVTICLCTFLAVRALVVLVAIFPAPRKEWPDRALQVLKVLRRRHGK